ncbi:MULTISPECIES: RDD family protein [unclassified Thioalkalivibrio]|uniref:RDD family protein n=1 Tax=unclassified Thioalkalivibrio TaxID=2621013 RepID=UPI00038280D3|nr:MULTISPECIES: RDD family protein [unclassified Thioalkalivibrio]
MECKACGRDNPPEARYCNGCGADLVEVAAASPAHAGPPEDRAAFGGFWRRVLATLFDMVVIGVPQIVAQMVISPETMAPKGPEPELMAADIVWMLINILVAWLYWAGMHSSRYQATVGKMAVGLRVVDYHGERITFMRATGRYLAEILSGLLFGIGYLMVAFTRRRQGLHDLIAETFVVRKEWLN